MSRFYQLSYDTINCDRHFQDNYNEARRYMLCVIASSPIVSIESYTESSLILEYNEVNPTRLFRFLQNNLSSYFYYSVSLVAKHTNTAHQYIDHNPNVILNTNLQAYLNGIQCDNLGKRITNY